ncbi:MAG: FecR family protein [Defluviitaleaceae bacterium]|nr:FecR family protein [Defluviitaleaceae bacterium]MCL2275269.1 FecR family protein [Defluviitaleaceae bacterium]
MKKAIFMLVAIAVALLASVTVYAATSRTIVIESVNGTVNMTRGTARSFTAREGTRLAAGNTVSTGANSYAVFLLDDGSTLRLDASTTVDVTRAGNNLEVTVVTGSLAVSAAPQTEGRRINVRAGNATMGVRGTLFTVVLQNGGVQVNLLEGELEGTTPYASVILYAGQALVICDEGTAEAQPLQVNMLDAFTLQTIADNAEMLIETGIIAQRDIRTIYRLIETRQAEAAQAEELRKQAIDAVAAEYVPAEEYTPEDTSAYTPSGGDEVQPPAGGNGAPPTGTPAAPPAAPQAPAAPDDSDDGEYEEEEYVDSEGRVRRRWRWRRSR